LRNKIVKLDPLAHVSTSDLIEVIYQRSCKVKEIYPSICNSDRLTLLKATQNFEEHMLDALLSKSN
jgi:hypothetical protein